MPPISEAFPSLPLAERSIRAILSEAWTLYRGRFIPYVVVSTVALMFAWTLDLILRVWVIGARESLRPDDAVATILVAEIWRVFVAGIANGMVYALLGFATQGVLAIDAVTRLRGGAVTIGGALIAVGRHFRALALATLCFFGGAALLISSGSLLSGIAAALGLTGGVIQGFLAGTGVLAACAVATFALTLRWAFFPQAVVLEGLGPLQALGRSMYLTRTEGGTWSARVAEIYLVRAAALMIIVIGVQTAAGSVGAVAKLAAGWWLGGLSDLSLVSAINPTGMPVQVLIPLEVFSVLLSSLVLPWSLLASTLLYLDVRARREAARREPPQGAIPDVRFHGGMR